MINIQFGQNPYLELWPSYLNQVMSINSYMSYIQNSKMHLFHTTLLLPLRGTTCQETEFALAGSNFFPVRKDSKDKPYGFE